jgi:hypothetical protein
MTAATASTGPRALRTHDMMKKGPAIRMLSGLARPLAPWLDEGVFVFHQGRCGSTVLAHLLDRHPRLTAFGEIFETPYQRRRLQAPAAAMLRARRTQALPGRAVVEAKFFECQHLSLLGLTLEAFVDLLRDCGYRRFVVLDRKNYLQKILSSRLALARGRRFHYAAGEAVPQTQVDIDVDGVQILGKHAPMLEMFAYMDDQYARLRAALAGAPVLELTFEDDIVADPHTAYARVCTWLGLEPVPVETDLRRSNTRAPREVIGNWDEVAATLSGTPYAWMLD